MVFIHSVWISVFMKAAGSQKFEALDRSCCTGSESRGRKNWPGGTPDCDEGTVDNTVSIHQVGATASVTSKFGQHW